MANTTIGIDNEIKTGLEALKGDMTFNDFFKKILEEKEGTIVDDVVEIKRPQTAFTLESVGYGGDEDALKSYWGEETSITFADLANAKVGDRFYSPNHNYMYSYDEEAEVIFKDKNSVFVRVTSTENIPTGFKVNVNLLHVMLF